MVYEVRDLGTLGGPASIAYGVNEHGQVAGEASTATGKATHAFFWSPTKGMLDLGTLGGSRSVARGINAWGEVAGQAELSGDGAYHAFVWGASTGMLHLQPLPGDTHCWASGIDDAGTVYGASGGRSGCVQAVRWRGAAPAEPLGFLGSKDSEACGGTAAGVVVGFSTPPGLGCDHAFVRNPSGSMRDLGTLGGKNSKARMIGKDGGVVGFAEDAEGRQRPCKWQGSVVTDVGMNPASTEGVASSINKDGLIVGTEKVPGTARPKRAILFRNAKTYDLDAIAGIPREEGWTLEWATSINDVGQIVGQGIHNGKSHAFLLTPES